MTTCYSSSWKHSHSTPDLYRLLEILDVFRPCVVAELSAALTSIIPAITPVASNPPHCARSLTPWGDELVICGRWICLRSICITGFTSSCSSFPWNRKPKNIFLRRNLLFYVLTLYRLLFQMSASAMEELITRISLSSVRKSSAHLQETLNSQPTDERSWWWGYLRVSSPLSLISVTVSLTYRSQDRQ